MLVIPQANAWNGLIVVQSEKILSPLEQLVKGYTWQAHWLMKNDYQTWVKSSLILVVSIPVYRIGETYKYKLKKRQYYAV